MKHSDFSRGLEFYTGSGKWRCTDVGSRVIAAISLEPRTRVTVAIGPDGERAETHSMSTDPDDLHGPPYGVAEHVFDEYDFGGCYLDEQEIRAIDARGAALVAELAQRRRLAHPSPTVDIERVAELDVSAASGLVALADRLYVVADDEHFIASYDFSGRPLGRLALWPGELPDEHAERKRLKPDLESLTRLPGGRLLALGSGSTARRRRGALVEPSSGSVRHVDLTPLYELLATRVPDLNIEGAAVLEDRLWLAHRGNGRSRQSACIELDLEAIEALLAGTATLEDGTLRAVHAVDLGELNGVPLGLTDLTSLPGRGLLFCAAAEASPDTYEDGPCAGSVLGLLDRKARVVRLATVSAPCKLEGIASVSSGRSGIELWLVADPDDRALRAPLFHATDLRGLLA